MEPEDLNPRSKPTRSPSLPLFYSPCVPEVSLMLNKPQWQNSQTFSPIENVSRLSQHQKYLSATGYGVTHSSMADSKNIQAFNLRETDSNAQKIHGPNIFREYEQLRRYHHTSEDKRETNCRNKFVESAIESTNAHKNIYTDRLIDSCPNIKQHTENINDSHQISSNGQNSVNRDQGYFQQTAGREMNKANSKKNEHYNGWRTYFEDRTSSAHCNIQTSFRSSSSFHVSQEEERSYSNRKACSQNPNNTQRSEGNNGSQISANNNENKIGVGDITESQLENIVLKVMSNLKNSFSPQHSQDITSVPQAEVQVINEQTGIQNKKEYMNNTQRISVTSLMGKAVSSNEKNVGQHCSNSRKREEREFELGTSSLENENMELMFDKQNAHGTTDITHEGKVTCNQKCDCHVSFIKLYKLLRSQATHLKVLQEKVDKIIVQQEKSMNISQSSFTRRDHSEFPSERRPKRMIHVSTQTTEPFHREIAVGTDPQETASVGIMTENCESIEHSEGDPVFLFERERNPYGATSEMPRNVRNEQTLSEDMHHQDSICLNSLNLPSMQVEAPSPLPSIHVDMHDFEDDDINSESSHCSNADSQQPVRVGLTFYNKVVEQVNKLLQESSKEKAENQGVKYVSNKGRPYDAVRNATIEQLQKMGISIHSDADQDVRNEPCDSDNLRFNAMAQLCNISMKTTNFSLATLQYLEKYHLLPSNQQVPYREVVNNRAQAKSTQNTQPHAGNFDKILDVTTIKNQPKLL
ncbi:hypothetical protein L9F63_012174 [Diploptera punctata]|uniref:Uncharacterized protein n=1 Tax=Diploptera punctata TaxID=6984 RepID=A0AAD8ACW2_DIPPU|nr:hypothetical protein L9F63_012174 [Diploptera punctata]